jgi:hypothetical protein
MTRGDRSEVVHFINEVKIEGTKTDNKFIHKDAIHEND